jgi:outer membrane murein-binding lipoprotein Lpp
MQFDGPTTILVQSRGPRINDVLSAQEVNEIADVPRGLTSPASQPEAEKAASDISELTRSVEQLEQEIQGTRQSVAKIRKDGKAEVDEAGRN